MAPNQKNEDISAYGVARSTIEGSPLDAEQLHKMNVYFRASLYLSLKGSGVLIKSPSPMFAPTLITWKF